MKQIYIDKASGKDFNPRKYKSLIRKLKEGDELYIKFNRGGKCTRT